MSEVAKNDDYGWLGLASLTLTSIPSKRKKVLFKNCVTIFLALLLCIFPTRSCVEVLLRSTQLCWCAMMSTVQYRFKCQPMLSTVQAL